MAPLPILHQKSFFFKLYITTFLMALYIENDEINRLLTVLFHKMIKKL